MRQYFGKELHRCRINKTIRDHVLFAPHNVLRDPPFSRVGLISCRNLPVYLERELQQHLLETFHFALRPGGFLLLGSLESIDGAVPHFEVVDKHHRIYRDRPRARSDRQAAGFMPVMVAGRAPAGLAAHAERRTGLSFADVHDVHQRVLEFHAPSSPVSTHTSASRSVSGAVPATMQRLLGGRGRDAAQ